MLEVDLFLLAFVLPVSMMGCWRRSNKTPLETHTVKVLGGSCVDELEAKEASEKRGMVSGWHSHLDSEAKACTSNHEQRKRTTPSCFGADYRRVIRIERLG